MSQSPTPNLPQRRRRRAFDERRATVQRHIETPGLAAAPVAGSNRALEFLDAIGSVASGMGALAADMRGRRLEREHMERGEGVAAGDEALLNIKERVARGEIQVAPDQDIGEFVDGLIKPGASGMTDAMAEGYRDRIRSPLLKTFHDLREGQRQVAIDESIESFADAAIGATDAAGVTSALEAARSIDDRLTDRDLDERILLPALEDARLRAAVDDDAIAKFEAIKGLLKDRQQKEVNRQELLLQSGLNRHRNDIITAAGEAYRESVTAAVDAGNVQRAGTLIEEARAAGVKPTVLSPLIDDVSRLQQKQNDELTQTSKELAQAAIDQVVRGETTTEQFREAIEHIAETFPLADVDIQQEIDNEIRRGIELFAQRGEEDGVRAIQKAIPEGDADLQAFAEQNARQARRNRQADIAAQEVKLNAQQRKAEREDHLIRAGQAVAERIFGAGFGSALSTTPQTVELSDGTEIEFSPDEVNQTAYDLRMGAEFGQARPLTDALMGGEPDAEAMVRHAEILEDSSFTDPDLRAAMNGAISTLKAGVTVEDVTDAHVRAVQMYQTLRERNPDVVRRHVTDGAADDLYRYSLALMRTNSVTGLDEKAALVTAANNRVRFVGDDGRFRLPTVRDEFLQPALREVPQSIRGESYDIIARMAGAFVGAGVADEEEAAKQAVKAFKEDFANVNGFPFPLRATSLSKASAEALGDVLVDFYQTGDDPLYDRKGLTIAADPSTGGVFLAQKGSHRPIEDAIILEPAEAAAIASLIAEAQGIHETREANARHAGVKTDRAPFVATYYKPIKTLSSTTRTIDPIPVDLSAFDVEGDDQISRLVRFIGEHVANGPLAAERRKARREQQHRIDQATARLPRPGI